MILIKRDNPKIYGGKAYLVSREEDTALNSIASAISINRGLLVDLLRKHDIRVEQNATKDDLLKKASYSFEINTSFANDFYKTFVSKFSNVDGDEEDAPSTQMGGTDGYTAATVGIMSAISKILGMFSKPDSTGQQMQYNQQILALAAEKERQKKRNQTIAIVLTVAAVIGITIFTIYYAKRKKAL